MKTKLILLLFFINFSLVFSQEKKNVENLIQDIVNEYEEYLSLKLNPVSFIPELDTDLKNDEIYKHTMNEVKDNNFVKYFTKVKKQKR